MQKKEIIILGFMGGCPIAGVIWQHLHYIIGLQRLGHRVLYVEDTGRFPYNPVAFDISDDDSYATQTLSQLGTTYGFEWAYAARYKNPHTVTGLSSQQLSERLRHCDAALNICGSHDLNEELLTIANLIYVESDPGVEQIKVDQQDPQTLDFLKHHHHLFSFGENIGTPAFPVPLHGLSWLPTRQPIVTDLWCSTHNAPPPPSDASFTSICNWSTSGKKDITWQGSHYLWSKSLAFLDFIEAPERFDLLAQSRGYRGAPIELATDIPEQETRKRFEQKGWRLSLPHELSIHSNDYRNYIISSFGEFTCAKDQYVRLKTGWFSDRSACYLAAGRPVVTQETGFSSHYGYEIGGDSQGLLSFSSLEEAQQSLLAIQTDYPHHSQAALKIAREYFEADKVLGSLLERAHL